MKLEISGILFSIFITFALRAALQTKPVVSNILFSISVTFVLKVALVINPVIISASS